MTKTISSINSANAGISTAVGSVWYNGTGVPSNASGNNGDYYLNDSTGDVYNKTNGSWTIVANIKGANGASGSTISWQTITNNYTAVNGDCLFVDTSSAALTITLPASPSLGWVVTLQDPKGSWPTNNVTVHSVSEEINYQSSDDLILDVSDGVTLLYSGESWIVSQGGFGSAGPAGSMVKLAAKTSNTTAVVFNNIPGIYSSYIIAMDNVTVATSSELIMQFSVNNGSSFISDSYSWAHTVVDYSGNTGNEGNSSQAGIVIAYSNGTPYAGNINLFSLGSPVNAKKCTYNIMSYATFSGGGFTNDAAFTTNAVNALQIYSNSSAFTAGTFTLYGIV